MSFNQQQLCDLIPHAGVMCLLDQVKHWDDDSISCTSISQTATTNPLLHQQVLPSICGIEYAAQAMAIHGAILERSDSPPTSAFIAGLRSIKLFTETLNQYPELEINCSKFASDDNGFIYDFFIQQQNQVLVSGRATVIKQRMI